MRKLFYITSLGLFSFMLGSCGAKESAVSADHFTTEELSAEAGEGTEHLLIDSETITEPQTVVNQNSISITEISDNKTYYAEDGTSPVLEVDASYPQISIPEHDDISEKINNAIKQELDTFFNFEEQNASYAREDYKMAADDESYTFEPYTGSFSYTVKRCDKQVISIVFSQYDYTGGAHGNPWQYGVTFDVSNGNKVQLEALSDDFSGFYDMLLTDLTNQAKLPAYQNYIFTDFAADVETALLKDSSSWYFDSSGITFISNPYVLGPYAAGTFEFNISYDHLKGLKDSYGYQGSYVCKLFPGVSVTKDINADGVDEEICYSIISGEDFSGFDLSFVINGQDFSRELDRLNIAYPYTGAYYLVDIDPEDEYVEIAIMDNNYDANKEFTHFFRYTKDKTVTYLGNIPKLYHEGEIVCYDSNGNLVLLNTDGTPAE